MCILYENQRNIDRVIEVVEGVFYQQAWQLFFSIHIATKIVPHLADKQIRILKTYSFAIIARDGLVLAVDFDLLIIDIILTREDSIDYLLARDILDLSA
jgi:hypothetical protein